MARRAYRPPWVMLYPDDPTPAAAAFIEEYNTLYGGDPDYYGACAFVISANTCFLS